MENSNISALKEQFSQECKVINLKYEYEGYDGEENWAIVTELSKQDLFEKYSEIVGAYVPFVLLSVAQGEAIHIFNKNEHKHEMRQQRMGQLYSIDSDAFDECHPEVATDDLFERVFRKIENEELYKAIEQLKPIQRTRLVRYYFQGMPYRRIAKEDGVHPTKVKNSIEVAIKNLKKFLN